MVAADTLACQFSHSLPVILAQGTSKATLFCDARLMALKSASQPGARCRLEHRAQVRTRRQVGVQRHTLSVSLCCLAVSTPLNSGVLSEGSWR